MNPLDAFDRILALLHQAALDDAQWLATAALIDEVCGTTGNALVVAEGSASDARVCFARYLYRGESRPDLAREYFDVYYPHDEGPPRLRERPAGQVVHVPDLYTEEELRTSPAYNESWRRREVQNGLIMRLDRLDDLRIVWAIGDPVGSGGWESAQLQLIESLLPHIRQFICVRQALVGADALSASLAGLLDNSRIGVLHLDRGRRVLAANAPALDILRRGEGLSDKDGTLRATVPADHGRLQRLLKHALPGFGIAPPTGGSMTIRRPLLPSRLELHVHPVGVPQADFGGGPGRGAGAGGRPGEPPSYRPGPGGGAARLDAVRGPGGGVAGRGPGGARDRRGHGFQGKLRSLASEAGLQEAGPVRANRPGAAGPGRVRPAAGLRPEVAPISWTG